MQRALLVSQCDTRRPGTDLISDVPSSSHQDQYVPEVSALDPEVAPLEVDVETKEMLRGLGFESIPVTVTAVAAPNVDSGRAGRRHVVGARR